MALCNGTGKLVKRIQTNAENRYGIVELPSGAYYLVLEDKNKRIVQVLEFVKP